jgi:type I restriction enzyme, S subunit
MIPKGWKILDLEKVAQIQTGLAKGKKGLKDSVRLPYLRVANVQDGWLDLTEIKEIEVEQHQINRYLLQDEDILLTEGGDFDKLGRGTIWHSQINPCLHQNHVFAVRVNREKLLPYFFAQQIGSFYGKSYFLSCAKQTTNLASINSTQLKEFPVLLPPFPEQHKIAKILETWDKSIDLLTQTIGAKRKLKQGLMQQLLTADRRFKEFEKSKWSIKKLSQVIERIRNPVSVSCEDSYNEIGIRSHGKGIFYKEPITGINLGDKSVFWVEPDCFVVNIVFAWEQAVALTTENERGMIASHRFPMYQAKDNAVLLQYLLYFFLTPKGKYLLELASPGGAGRNKTLGQSEFLNLEIMLPSFAEQEKIAAVLSAADDEITTLETQLTAVKQQKRGLMQQLLTGKKRVKV